MAIPAIKGGAAYVGGHTPIFVVAATRKWYRKDGIKTRRTQIASALFFIE